MLSYAKLPTALKRRIVMMVAKGFLLSEIARVLHDEHGITLSLARLQRYDPRTATGSALSADLKELFESTHRQAIEDLETRDMAYRPMRIAALERRYVEAVEKGDLKNALKALDQIRVEMTGIELIDIDLPKGEAW